MELRLPKEKLSEIKDRLTIILNSRKLKLREIQSVIGLLNFSCQVVVPGRAFRRRLIDATCNVKKAWHRVRITKAMKKDLSVWLEFLENYIGHQMRLSNCLHTVLGVPIGDLEFILTENEHRVVGLLIG